MSLLVECREPALEGDTFGDVVGLAVDLQEALRACNADKFALRKWRKDHEGADDGGRQ